MKKDQFILILLMMGLFASCTYHDKNEESDKKEQAEYDAKLTPRNKELINRFLNDELPIQEGFDKIYGGFYCLWKRRNIEIKPHFALNRKFKENGYNVTLSQEMLRYVIVSETNSHRVGSYSNGAEAATIETIISVIDLKNGTAYSLKNHLGGSPPTTTRNRSVDIGSFWGDDDIYNNIKNEVVK